jgi:hypothetical protein
VLTIIEDDFDVLKIAGMNRIIISIVTLLLILGNSIQAQELDAAVVQNAIETKSYVFKPQSASPKRGGFRQLTPDYELVVKPDTVVSYLPYYGRSYSAPINQTDAGINFTSMNYEYSINNKKKDRWDITIKPKDVSAIRDLNLTVYDNGRASLRVNSNDKDAITFDGYLKVSK